MRAHPAGAAVLALLVGSVLASARPRAAAPPGDRAGDGAAPARQDAGVPDGSAGCLSCHAGIEAMHPEARLSCVDCHGGDATARTKAAAHVAEPRSRQDDESVAPRERDLAWRRFRDPMDLRVVDRTCGTCHADQVARLGASLHATTAGHLSDGFYEMGLFEERGSRYSVFPVNGAPREGGEVERLVQVPPFDGRAPADRLSSHYADLPRKECMQCHLWSEGRAVRGRVGFDGDYRGEGCAACHVAFALDGLSESADPTVARNEPGHPRRHEMTRTPTTATCTSCHYGDASIGLSFRGLSQLPPNAPGGPEIPGTTDRLLNRQFYLDDPSICPPDLHFAAGMDCIDCHTQSDVMGDGELHGQMEHAVEITCEACHGTFERVSQLVTERGTPLDHLRRDGDRFVLTTKATGKELVVPQAAWVVDPSRPEYDARAAEAMTARHADLECYTCHAGWNPNFLGFHFSRNASLTQLDLLSGKRTPGRVTTQEKVFATWKSFYAGRDASGRIAPYLTGFSTMGSVWDENGELVIDQAMPVTAAGLSGVTMVHHQLHTTRPTARQCVECHRTSATWGMGSANFQLARQLAFVADRRGVEVVALDRRDLTKSAPLAKVVLPDVVALAADCDPLQGHAHHVYAAEGGRGIHVIDVRDPTAPRTTAFVATVDPQGLWLAGGELWVADGTGGVRVIDVKDPDTPREIGHVATFDAHAIEVRWPWAYVADGAGGLVILDAEVPIRPRVLAAVDTNGPSSLPNEVLDVATLFQYSRPLARDGEPADHRTRARNLACVVDRRLGLITVDVTEPTQPRVLWPRPDESTRSEPFGQVTYRGLTLLSQVDPAEVQGGARTAERDYAYVQQERGVPSNRRSQVVIVDVSDPLRPKIAGSAPSGYETEGLAIGDLYDPPFRQRIAFSPGERGVRLANVSAGRETLDLGTLPALRGTYAIALERFPLDRSIQEDGRALKDVSHPGSRWLYRAEIERILAVGADALAGGEPEDGETAAAGPDAFRFGETARLHFADADTDGSGFLQGDEIAAADAEGLDTNGDGRVSLLELGRGTAVLGLQAAEPRPEPPAELVRRERVDVDGDLARLLDRVDPWSIDRDHDGSLDARELDTAFFTALDLDGDDSLSRDELSRYPGELRTLRFHDAEAQAVFDAVDRNHDGRISPREFHVQDAEREALDPDGDGKTLLVAPPRTCQRDAGLVWPGSEWPTRRTALTFVLPLPPSMTAEDLLAAFDTDGDGVLTRKEFPRKDDLFELIDRAGVNDSRLTLEELRKYMRVFTALGVETTRDDFLGRWDLDQDGRVEPEELPAGVRLRLAPFLANARGGRHRR